MIELINNLYENVIVAAFDLAVVVVVVGPLVDVPDEVIVVPVDFDVEALTTVVDDPDDCAAVDDPVVCAAVNDPVDEDKVEVISVDDAVVALDVDATVPEDVIVDAVVPVDVESLMLVPVDDASLGLWENAEFILYITNIKTDNK